MNKEQCKHLMNPETCISCEDEKETEKRENELMKEQITKEKVREGLGTDNQLEEAIEVVYEIAIGQYSADLLKKDIMLYYYGNWEYKEDK